MNILYGLLISVIAVQSLNANPMELINTYWKKLVDTRQGLGDVNRYEMVTDVSNSKHIWTLVKFKHKPYIFKYDKTQGIWLAHTASPFDGEEKKQTIRTLPDGSLYAICEGRIYRWMDDGNQWKKIAGNNTGLPKRNAYLVTDISPDGTAWTLAVFKKRMPRLYRFDPKKNLWAAVGTEAVPIEENAKNITLRVHGNNSVYVIAEGQIVKWNAWRKSWNPIMKSRNGLPKAKKILTDVATDGSIWAAVSLKSKPTMLYQFDSKKNIWTPESVMPLNERSKDQEVRAISEKKIFAVADTTVYKLRT
jgi:hypothetical protein